MPFRGRQQAYFRTRTSPRVGEIQQAFIKGIRLLSIDRDHGPTPDPAETEEEN